VIGFIFTCQWREGSREEDIVWNPPGVPKRKRKKRMAKDEHMTFFML